MIAIDFAPIENYLTVAASVQTTRQTYLTGLLSQDYGGAMFEYGNSLKFSIGRVVYWSHHENLSTRNQWVLQISGESDRLKCGIRHFSNGSRFAFSRKYFNARSPNRGVNVLFCGVMWK